MSIYKIASLRQKNVFSIFVTEDLKISCNNYSELISIRHFLGFTAKLGEHTQLDAIIEFMKHQVPHTNLELSPCREFLSEVSDISELDAKNL